jgi:2-dehydro-3-deoxyphosphogluconate aldolase/(4S)-4-hydroxy-2-oxoglutarate aldolase
MNMPHDEQAKGREESVTAELERLRIVPVVVIHDPDRAVPLAKALMDGGLPCAEITFRTPGAPEALRRIAAELPNVFVGAGTVLSTRQVDVARDAGASFVVSPGFNPRVVDYCLELGMPVYPGVCTPTEIEAALEKGLRVLKFFPAEPMGGARFLSAIAAPFPGVRFIPTGGVGLEQLDGYLKMKQVVACGGSWIAPSVWIEGGDVERIREETRRAVEAAAQARPA